MNEQIITIPFDADIPMDGSAVALATVMAGSCLYLHQFILDDRGVPAIMITICMPDIGTTEQ